MHFLVAPHGPLLGFSNRHLEWERAFESDKKGLSHCRQLFYDSFVWCWMAEMAIPASYMMPRKS
jgi:hypothetical protein